MKMAIVARLAWDKRAIDAYFPTKLYLNRIQNKFKIIGNKTLNIEEVNAGFLDHTLD